MTPSPRSGQSATGRLLFLDWLRIGAFALLVVYHVGMYYVTWDFHLKSQNASTALEPWMRLSSPWRMDLLFLISGFATTYFFRRQGVDAASLWARVRRLVVPLLFGVLVIVPPQSWLEVVQKLGFPGSYWNFLGLYFTAYQDFCFAPGRCLILPTWNHLWFLPYVLTYTFVLYLVISTKPGCMDWVANRLATKSAGVGRVGWVVWPILYLALTRLLMGKQFPVSHALWGDWFAHCQHAAFFALGVVLTRTPQFWSIAVHLRWAALVAALGSWYLLVFAARIQWLADLPLQSIGFFLYSCQQWCAIIAALGFAQLHLNHDGPWRRYLTQAVFPVYILHQTLILLLADALTHWKVPLGLEGMLLVGLTMSLSLAGYEIIRRLPWARPLFGLSASKKQ